MFRVVWREGLKIVKAETLLYEPSWNHELSFSSILSTMSGIAFAITWAASYTVISPHAMSNSALQMMVSS